MADTGSNGQRTEFKAVGRANVPGRLSYTIATGRAKFGNDAVVPGMLHAKFLRSPYGRVKIKRMDVSKAKALAKIPAWTILFARLLPYNSETISVTKNVTGYAMIPTDNSKLYNPKGFH